MKKRMLALMGAIAVLGLTACQNENNPSKEPTNPDVVVPTPEPTPAPTPAVDNNPAITGKIIDYLPKSPTCAVTATVDLKGATNLTITTGTYTLIPDVDYELVDGELKIFGTVFEQQGLGIGSHKFEFVTEKGTKEFSFNVVSNPAGTTIPTKTIKGIDMSGVEAYAPTEPIANAPELLMTEIIHGAGEYTYVEVFNNTNKAYNLKGHRIVLGYADNEGKSSLLKEHGIVENAVGGGCSAYIYQNYEIPALKSAVIWLVASAPWKTITNLTPEQKAKGITHAIKLDENYESHMFGSNEANLSIEKFKDTLKLAKDTLVFPVRPQKSLMNGTYKLDQATGMGGILTKGSGFSGISSTVKRILQIQKIDQETHFTKHMEGAPAGSAYYRYEMGVVNKEEEIFNNGVYDESKVVAYGGRQCVNGLFMRQVFYDAQNNKLGYVTDAKFGIDLYNTYSSTDNKPLGVVVRNSALESMKPIVSAFIYPNIGNREDGSVGTIKWDDMTSCEYTVPENGSKIMRFIPRSEGVDYSIAFPKTEPFYDLIMGGIAETNGDVMYKDIVIPVDPSYNTDYVTAYTTTPGITGWFNFKSQK